MTSFLTHQRAALLALGTATPRYQVEQAAVGEWTACSFGDSATTQRWLKRLYQSTGIETRYSCLPDALLPPDDARFAPGHDLADAPTTAERMAIYERESVVIGAEAARRAIADYRGPDAPDEAAVIHSITHLITVSCTGFFAPGLDQMIARAVGLRPETERVLIGFMGCAAAFNALRLASQIVAGQPTARVLIVCVELCSLHIQPSKKLADLIGAAIFADGAGACIVGRPHPEQGDVFAIDHFYTELTPEAESFMVWRIGDWGYTLHLSTQIPERLAEIAPRALLRLFNDQPPDLRFWAIHPGGRAIVDRLEEIFHLSAEQVAPSREILRCYGNMSSPTVLFVLQEYRTHLRQQADDTPVDGVAMAFGPGLVTELAHLVYVPAAVLPLPMQNGSALRYAAYS
ncbi:MAG: type III polyketide synthase [Chloroflexaceae bacterium]|nr:type III polyketide synthase [Chloroflexaceae bacterium]NJO05518.1 type III polyketide synthase [Chloroflexaceae bacterium]